MLTFINAPTRCGVEVSSLERKSNFEHYLLTTDNDTIEAANVGIATGPFQLAVIPAKEEKERD
jgi:putative flavoprotein involved in K+ transport